MKTLVMDGFRGDSDCQARVVGAVTAELSGRGWEWDTLTPRDMKIGPCSGCFGCWTKRPGMCVQEDDVHLLCSSTMASDLLLIVSPLTFGGYSSETKKAMDRVIGLISPFFMAVNGEVHHRPRYDRFPAMAALGVNHDNCPRCPEIFRTLLYRNAINLHTGSLAVSVVEDEELDDGRIRSRVADLLDQARSSVFAELSERRIRREEFVVEQGEVPLVDLEHSENKRALLLIGSPKVRSTSSAIADALCAGLRDRGWQTDTKRILPAVAKEAEWQALIKTLDSARLVVLASPLYVDSFPAPVTKALELVASHRKEEPVDKRPGLVAVLNNGFPEPAHSHTALGIARQFALEAGYEWMGGLALGMGGAIDGKPLSKMGRMVRNVVKALDLTAGALNRGLPVPAEAVDLFARPLMPRWLYTTVGNRGWKKQAKKNGVADKLMDRPYSTVAA
jgi:multimeric flavodoxin WrbA